MWNWNQHGNTLTRRLRAHEEQTAEVAIDENLKAFGIRRPGRFPAIDGKISRLIRACRRLSQDSGRRV
jgi:hypothetical protein